MRIILSQLGVFLLDLQVQMSNRASSEKSDAYPTEQGTSPQADVEKLNQPCEPFLLGILLYDFTVHHVDVDLYVIADGWKKWVMRITIAGIQLLTGPLLSKGLLIESVIASIPEEKLRKIVHRATLLGRIGYCSKLRNRYTQSLYVLLVGLEQLRLLMWIV